MSLVEARDLGGTCVNRGCTPTKTLQQVGAVAYRRVVRPSSVQVGPVKVDFAVAVYNACKQGRPGAVRFESRLGGLQGLRIIKTTVG